MQHQIVDSFHVALGRAIAGHRKWRRLTGKELAKDLGITNVHLSYVEHGKTSVSLDLLRTIAARFGITLGALINDAESNV